MSNLSDTEKLNYLFKKTLNKPSTNPSILDIQEPNMIAGNIVKSKSIVFQQNELYRDNISKTVPSELINVTLDDNGNNINGSLIGKKSNDTLIKKYVKIDLNYVYGSEEIINNKLNSIAFYSNLLENTIPYNFDPQGSYLYTIYRPDGITEVSYGEGEWILDNESGVLTFYGDINENISINKIIKTNPPKITFYKYNGEKGLYPLDFKKNELLTIQTNLNITNNLEIKENTTLNNIHFNKLNELPSYNTNQIVYVGNNLYFNTNNKWQKLINDDLILLNHEQYIYNSNVTNIINVNTNLSIIEIKATLTNDIYIVLPLLQKNGIEKTIIMGQSVNKYINGYNIILYSKFIDVGGTGPVYMNLRFINTGQLVKLVSIKSDETLVTTAEGGGEKYWQIVVGHFHSNDIFESNGTTIVNQTDSGTYTSYVDDTQYEQISNVNIDNTPYENNMVDTHFININGTNTISLLTNTTLLQLNTYLTSDIIITLNTISNTGQKKTILVGDSIQTFKGTYKIKIKSTYMGGYNTNFLNTVTVNSYIDFSKSGQSVNLISMKSTTNVNYWHIMSGDFDLST